MGKSKYEKTIRYSIAIFAILLEVSFQLWQMYYGKWNFAESVPSAFMPIDKLFGNSAIFAKSHKIFKIAYFWCLGGVVSILFPDILHGPDRFRYYHHMISHILFFYMYMYMLFVLKFELNFKAFKKSYLYVTSASTFCDYTN